MPRHAIPIVPRPTEYVVRLPWPDPGLSPNARLHRMAVASLKRKAKSDAHACALADLGLAGRAELQGASALDVTVTFHRPIQPGPKLDDDNAIGRLKSARDGIAQAIGVNDRLWRVSYRVAEPVRGGCVLVALRVADGGVR